MRKFLISFYAVSNLLIFINIQIVTWQRKYLRRRRLNREYPYKGENFFFVFIFS